MANIGSGKMERVLGIYTRLINGQTVNKAEEAQKYRENERSIQQAGGFGGKIPYSLQQQVRGRGIPQAGTVHVRRKAAEGEIQVFWRECGSSIGQASNSTDPVRGRRRICGVGGSVWERN